MHRFRAYGLAIVSDVHLPELPPIDSADSPGAGIVEITLVKNESAAELSEPSQWASRGRGPDGEEWILAGRVPDGFIIRFVDMAEFFIGADGRVISLRRCAEDVSPVTLRHLLIDNVLPHALRLMGVEAIHATAVETAAGVCAFLGPSGAGKSTIAAGMAKAGQPAFADDCLVLDTTGETVMVVPAYPGVRLWSDSAAEFDPGLDVARPVADYTEKMRLDGGRSHDNFPTDSLPLACIYRLMREGDGETVADVPAPSIEQISPVAALQELIGATFRLETDNPAILRREFIILNEVARRVPMRRLYVPNDMSMLPAVCAAVLDDVIGGDPTRI